MIPRWVKEIPLFWPVACTAVGIVVTGASANTRLNDLTDKVSYIWDRGSPAEMPTLARIDERQTQMQRTLDKMDHKLDSMDLRAHDNDAAARGRDDR